MIDYSRLSYTGKLRASLLAVINHDVYLALENDLRLLEYYIQADADLSRALPWHRKPLGINRGEWNALYRKVYSRERKILFNNTIDLTKLRLRTENAS